MGAALNDEILMVLCNSSSISSQMIIITYKAIVHYQ